MLRAIFLPWVKYFTAFNVLSYISFRAVAAAITALLLSLLLGPAVIQWLRRMKLHQEIRQDGPNTHLGKKGTPTMGGSLIVLAIGVSTLLWQDLRSRETWFFTLALVGFAVVGFFDDYLKISQKNTEGLHSRIKLLAQVLVSLLVSSLIYLQMGDTQLHLPFTKNLTIDLGWFYIPFGVLVMVSTSNAVNLSDGLDGLATGLLLIALVPIAIIAYVSGRFDFSNYLYLPHIPGASELTIPILAFIGAALGFLWFNTHPAQVMMGDTGSLAYGGGLATLSLLLKKELLLLVIGGVFVIETLSVIVQVLYFKRTGRRILRMAPLHHHFELKGWHENQVVTRFWILGVMFALLGLILLKVR